MSVGHCRTTALSQHFGSRFQVWRSNRLIRYRRLVHKKMAALPTAGQFCSPRPDPKCHNHDVPGFNNGLATKSRQHKLSIVVLVTFVARHGRPSTCNDCEYRQGFESGTALSRLPDIRAQDEPAHMHSSPFIESGLQRLLTVQHAHSCSCYAITRVPALQ